MKIIRRKKKKNIGTIKYNSEWKEKNKIYLKELEIFFDRVENVKDVELRDNIINQMLRCDKILTELAGEMFLEYYQKGYEKAKSE